LIIDQVMPDITGERLIKEIKPSLSGDCRIILISGHTDQVEHLDMASLGIDYFLPKPLDMNHLKTIISAHSETKISKNGMGSPGGQGFCSQITYLFLSLALFFTGTVNTSHGYIPATSAGIHGNENSAITNFR
jgi:DNA-binding response OmpR family regulator